MLTSWSREDLSGFFCVLQNCVSVGYDILLFHEQYISYTTTLRIQCLQYYVLSSVPQCTQCSYIKVCLVNKANLVHNFISMVISFLYMLRRLCAHHQEKQLHHVTLGICHSVWMTVWYAGCTLHTTQSSMVSHRYSCFS